MEAVEGVILPESYQSMTRNACNPHTAKSHVGVGVGGSGSPPSPN